MFEKPQVLEEPGTPREVSSPAAASAVAGIDVRSPSELPGELKLEKILVEGRGEARLTVHADQVRALLAAADVRDLDVPPGVDGRSVTVRKPPIVIQRYASARRHVDLVQARSPEVELPPGLDLAQLAEIGMRILGVDRTESRRLARSIDWHTTLLVPVPANASSFRAVEIHGNPGLLVTTSG